MTSSLQCALLVGDTRQLQSVDIPRLPLLTIAELCRLLPDAPELSDLRRQLAGVLRHQLTPSWIGSSSLTSLFAVLGGLHAYDAAMVGGRDLGLIAKRLLSTEMAVGGPYTDTPDAPPDPIANAFIHNCLEWMAAPLPNVVSLVEGAFGNISADVEPADFGLYALLVKWEAGVLSSDAPEGAPESTPRHAFTEGPARSHADLFYAADLLCAAILASVAHCLWGHLAWAVLGHGCAKEVVAACRREIRGLPCHLQFELGNMLERIARADHTKEISQMAQYFAWSQENAKTVDRTILVRLGVANTFAWAANTIYDDFLDNEGTPHMLGAANCALRMTVRIYREILSDSHEFQAIDQALSLVDDANTRETLGYRFIISEGMVHIASLPDFGTCELLAERAIFHVLGPMTVLIKQGVTPGTEVWDNTLTAFKQYLIARQINDDIHDWVEDLRAGNATVVVVKVLRALGLGAGVYRLEQLMPAARQIFWRHVLPQVCDMAIAQIVAARKELLKDISPLREQSNSLGALLDRVENSLRQAAHQKEQSEGLLDVFSGQH